jgi:hypothetical protein
MVETDDVTHHTGVLTGVSLTAPAPAEPVGTLVITAVRASSIVKAHRSTSTADTAAVMAGGLSASAPDHIELIP